MKEIVIIGGGIAGLSAGCYAKMNGYDAHIFEMHNLPGGLCTSWKRKGYTQVSVGVNMDLSSDANLSNSVYYLYELDKPIMIAGEEKKHIHIKNYAFDQTFAPKGKSTLVVAFYVESAYWEQIYQDKEKYKQEKQNVETAVISSLEQIIPGIKDKIEVIDVSTPMTLIRYTNNWQGSIMGFINGLILNIPRTLPKLKNFYMACQWVGDAGLPGAASSGREILELICKKDKKKFITSNA